MLKRSVVGSGLVAGYAASVCVRVGAVPELQSLCESLFAICRTPLHIFEIEQDAKRLRNPSTRYQDISLYNTAYFHSVYIFCTAFKFNWIVFLEPDNLRRAAMV